MFVGHVGAALGFGRWERRLHPAAFILSALLLDLVLWSLVLVGREQVKVPAHYATRHYLTFVFPYSHSLVAAIVWAAAAWCVTGVAGRQWVSVSRRAGPVVAAAVVSHWLLDALVHIPDLPIAGPGSTLVGLGLWEHVPAAIGVEAAFTFGGFWLFVRGSRVQRKWALGLAVLLVSLLLLTLAGQTVADAPTNTKVLAATSLASDVIIVLLGGWLARRSVGPRSTPIATRDKGDKVAP